VTDQRARVIARLAEEIVAVRVPHRTRVGVLEADGPDEALLVLDGVFLARPELADCWDYRIFVAIDEDESIRRGVARDAWFLGGEDEARRLYEQRYVPGQRLYLQEARPLETADAVVDNGDPCQVRVVHSGP
jgi:uridine kinase